MNELRASYAERYKTDDRFRELVDQFTSLIASQQFTASELRGATWIAQEKAAQAHRPEEQSS